MLFHPSVGPSAAHFQKGWAQSNTTSPTPSLHGDEDPSQAVLLQAEAPGTPRGEPRRTGWCHHKPAPGSPQVGCQSYPISRTPGFGCWEILMEKDLVLETQRAQLVAFCSVGAVHRHGRVAEQPCSLLLPPGSPSSPSHLHSSFLPSNL